MQAPKQAQVLKQAPKQAQVPEQARPRKAAAPPVRAKPRCACWSGWTRRGRTAASSSTES